MNAVYSFRSHRNVTRLRNIRRKLKVALAEAKNKWITRQFSPLMCSAGSSNGNRWDAVKKLRSGLSKIKPVTKRYMTREDGTICENAKDNAEVFLNHFKKLFKRTPHYDESILDFLEESKVSEYTGIPTDEQIKCAVKRLKNNAPGDSGIPSAVWKALLTENETFSMMRTVVHNFWKKEVMPDEWETGLLKILPKKGDLSDPGNYRGIMLLETAYKIVAILLHMRLLPIIQNIDNENQCGFLPERGCVDAVFLVKMAIKKRREHGLETFVFFLDLVKAFDRVPREMLWKVMLKFGVPQKIIQLLKAAHDQVKVKFSVDGITHIIDSIIGVKQGDILGPILFVFYIAAIMIVWRKNYDGPKCIFWTKNDFVMTGRRINTKGEEFEFMDSEYADDTAIMFPCRDSLDKWLPKLYDVFEKFGMEIHSGSIGKKSKSEVLFVAAPDSVYCDPITYDGAKLDNVDLGEGRFVPIVDKFKYLGCILSRDGRDDIDVDARIKAAGSSFGALKSCLFSKTEVSKEAKRSIYMGLVLSILLYGSETWCLTEKLLNRLRTFHARCLRSMCRINRFHVWKLRISTDHLQKKLNIPSMDSIILQRQLRWAGHVARMEFERLPRKMLSCWVKNKRPRGAPQLTYGRRIKKCLKKADIDFVKWPTLAQDRVAWRGLIN